MSKHTQGEWVATDGNATGMIVVAPDQPNVRYRVAACGGPNREANARLISAAPDLLEAAIEAKLQIQYLHKKFSETGSGNAVLVKLDAAISKAEGQ